MQRVRYGNITEFPSTQWRIQWEGTHATAGVCEKKTEKISGGH